MKGRRISLVSYILFLVLMGFLWIKALKKENLQRFGDMDTETQITQLISELDGRLKKEVVIIIDEHFPQNIQSLFNKTINQLFRNFRVNYYVVFSRNYTNDQNNIQFYLKPSQQEKYISKGVFYHEAHLPVEQLEEEKIKNIIREIKRLLMAFIPIPSQEISTETQSRYINQLLIFDLFFIQTEILTPEKMRSITSIYKNKILMLTDLFGIDQQLVRINFMTIKKEFISDYLQVEDKYMFFFEEGLEKLVADHGFSDQHRTNYLPYVLSNTIIIYTDPQIRLIKQEFNEYDTYDFMYKAPNVLVNVLRDDSKLEDIIQLSVQETLFHKLDLFEQWETAQSLSFWQLEDFDLIVDVFQQREFQKYQLKWLTELKYVLFLNQEPDYLRTPDNYNVIKQKLSYIQNQLANQEFNTLSEDIVDITQDTDFGIFETFSVEYTLGVYLPLVLPFAYPILIGFVDEIKDVKRKRQASQNQ